MMETREKRTVNMYIVYIYIICVNYCEAVGYAEICRIAAFQRKLCLLPTFGKEVSISGDIKDSSPHSLRYLQDKGLQRDKMGKLKWLLHCTMGCQDTTFGTRKRELAILKGRASDVDVLNSYISSVDSKSSDPWMLEFIRMGHLSLIRKFFLSPQRS